MKKIIYKLIEEAESQTIYVGIGNVYGGWIATTSGNPITLNDLEEIEDEVARDQEIALYDSIINAGKCDRVEFCECRECNAEDVEYVSEWLRVWGL